MPFITRNGWPSRPGSGRVRALPGPRRADAPPTIAKPAAPSAQAKPTLAMSDVNWFLLIMLSVLWGGSFYFAKIAVAEIPPLTLALGRVTIAASALAIIARLSGAA